MGISRPEMGFRALREGPYGDAVSVPGEHLHKPPSTVCQHRVFGCNIVGAHAPTRADRNSRKNRKRARAGSTSRARLVSGSHPTETGASIWRRTETPISPRSPDLRGSIGSIWCRTARMEIDAFPDSEHQMLLRGVPLVVVRRPLKSGHGLAPRGATRAMLLFDSCKHPLNPTRGLLCKL
ncbi:hypothetical protein TRAPUB_10333 [Trametes pubescens]|uniref:Uncharacterized protein n=1 Tax=Trametes pubescens TaxID=154538 RepID=A0A1M2VZR9_TRAPU|nr:hypothetical protein TRAPUB_10333 [Trametes pubescens]